MQDDAIPGGTSKVPEDIDRGLALAYGKDSVQSASPSVLGRIGEITGSKPRLLLRDDHSGETPMLKPLGPDETREAGKYVVQGELGRGGVGTVHRGHDQDLGRDVAMKFLHEKYKSHPEVLQRFVEEAQIGGQLQHPGIVPVYDLGMVDGRPFFSMKLVKGQTLAKKLTDRESPTDDARTFLAIFEDVCQTLAYAHARGVVHRDLKPANIMIGSFGEVQVVDWGMGKVMQTGGVADEKLAAERQAELSVIETVRSAGHGTQSIMGSVMGTPAYMPPEQARGDVEHMDERSDVFALGAILCEILTGKPPYVAEDAGELIAMAAMAKLDDAHARLEASDSEPDMVDLATRCLMPAPAARPKSAEVVAKAVHQHLAAVESRVHEARVEAAEAKVRAASLKRTQKLGISLTVVIAAGLMVSLWLWRVADTAAVNEGIARSAAVTSAREAQQNEQLAVDQTKVAERELARAVEIKTLITEMLQSVDPILAQGADNELLKGILDTASQRLSDGAIEDELVAAELHALTGNVYQSIGLFPEAELHLSAALELRTRELGGEHADTLGSMADLATIYENQGRYAEAETLYRATLETQERVLGEEHPLTLSCSGNLAGLFARQGLYPEAETRYQDVLEAQSRVLGKDHPDTLKSMGNLAGLFASQGRYPEAEQLRLQTLEIQKRVLGEEHPITLSDMGNLATLYQNQGRYDDAQRLYLQTLEIQERVLGVEHPRTLASMSNLAILHARQGRFVDAETLLLRTLEIRTRVEGEEHPNTLMNMGNLASLYEAQGRYAEAEPLYLRTLEILQRVLGDEHPQTLANMVNLAGSYARLGRNTESESLYLEALEIQERVLGEEHPTTLMSMANLAYFYDGLARNDEAESLYLQTLEIQERVLGQDHPSTLISRTNLSNLYASMGRFDEALGMQREALDRQIAQADAADADVEVLNEAAWTLLTIENEQLRDPRRALGFAQRANTLAQGTNSERLWAILDTLALAQHMTDDTATAIVTQKRAIALMPEGADPEMARRLAEFEAAQKD
tara:strand:- start:5907 stop:8996 length:3090 start_codon:yes stop_codon:yes gene_type:complete